MIGKQKLKKIEIDYKAGKKHEDIAKKHKITPNQLIYLIRKNKWKRESNRSKTHIGNQNAKGNSGNKNASAPKHNKNAVTTGEYESIYKDVLDEEELEVFNNYSVENKVKELETELKLLIIREKRMLKRIATLNNTGKDLTINSITRNKSSTTEYGGMVSESSSTYAESTVEKIQRIEEALTRIQEAKRRCVDSIYKIEIENKKFKFQKDVYEASSKNNRKEAADKIQEYFNKLERVFKNE